jgi:hypothetical protein
MKLEIMHKTFSPSNFNLGNNGLTVIDYMELLGTPENTAMSNYERIEEVYRVLNEITRYNENRFTME